MKKYIITFDGFLPVVWCKSGELKNEEADMNNPDITLRCMNGFTVHIKAGNLIVESKRKEETFPISKIQSFALKEPRGISPGSITFRTAQAATSGIGLGFGVSAAIGAEQNFFFTKSEADTAVRIRDYISNFNTTQSEGRVVSVVEEIRGLKGLLDEGILTQEEFDTKKHQLLGI